MRSALISIFILSSSSYLFAGETGKTNSFSLENFVANKAKYSPGYMLEDKMADAWGIAIRPKGAGGHFWVTAKDVSYEYVGDVRAAPDKTLHSLSQDKLKTVTLPVGGDDRHATGTVFSDSKESFVITQTFPGGEPITAPAKFLFASDGGIISAWTERKQPDGSFDRSGVALSVIDQSKNGAQYFGLAVNSAYNRLYAANFGAQPGIEVFDGAFKPLAANFENPFDTNKNGKVDAGEFTPYNVQALTTPAGEHHVFVTYAKTKFCSKDGIKKGDCVKGDIQRGEEDTSKPGCGRLAEFTEEGKLVSVWPDSGKLSAPWGITYSPANFGALSGALLVGNFGNGTIAAFDPATHAFIDVMRNNKRKPLIVEKVWALLFGNGESLGDANALYFAAGPNEEKDGVFGAIRFKP